MGWQREPSLPTILRMQKRASAVLLLAGLLAAASAAAATSPHAQARALLTRCLTGLRTVPIVRIESNAVRSRRRATAAQTACSIILPMEPLYQAHEGDKAMQDAYAAAIKLGYGTSDYMEYAYGVQYGHQNAPLLHRAQREVAAGKRLAHLALSELG